MRRARRLGGGRRWARPLAFGFTLLGAAVWVAYVCIRRHETAIDAHAYFVGEYAGALGVRDAYLYSPAFSQLIEPLRWLGYDGFLTVWRLAEASAIVIFTGPFAGLLVLANPVALEVLAGNVHLLMGVAVVAGFRWPASWAFVLLTKVTPGIGLVWFAMRREWRNLGIALGFTAAIAVVSFAVDPSAWFSWLHVLAEGGHPLDPNGVATEVPLMIRLPAAVILVGLAAWRSLRWVVPIAVVLAMPVVWWHSLSVLVVVPYLYYRDRRVAPLESERIDTS